jgi:uncharacterized SAM-binding protein YcdF (DUF218 family)
MTASPDPRSVMKPGGAGRRRIAAAFAALVVVLLIDAVLTLLVWRGGEIESAPIAAPVDAAIVYFTDDAAARSRRLETAMALYDDGRARRLGLVGGFRRAGVATGAEKMAQAAIAAGAAEADVYFDERSFDTTSNVAAAIEIARANGWTRLVHVSDGMHLARIRDEVLSRAPEALIDSGFAAAPYGGAGEIWARAHYEAATRLLTLLLSENGVRRLARRLRVQEGETT